MGFNYYILDGQSFQWCLPPLVFKTLSKSLMIETELFASPINVQLPHFYSLFKVDQVFGAIDNLFSLCPSSLLDGGRSQPSVYRTCFRRKFKNDCHISTAKSSPSAKT